MQINSHLFQTQTKRRVHICMCICGGTVIDRLLKEFAGCRVKM